MAKKAIQFKEYKESKSVKLDLGSGKGLNTPEGFVRVDKHAYKGTDVVTDLTKVWPWKANSVDEMRSNFVLHYLTPAQRIHFMNEACRCLKVGAQLTIYVPHWATAMAYGDPTCPMPPISEAWFPFMNKNWREMQSFDIPSYTCDFDIGGGWSLHPDLHGRSDEYVKTATTFWKEAIKELIVTFTKKG